MADHVVRSLDDLRVGQILTHAIYDPGGILLLAAGRPITAESLQNMKARGITSVVMHAADATGGHPEPPDIPPAEPIDDLQWLLTFSGDVRNTGPPARDSVVKQGRKPYDRRFHKQLVEQRQQSCEVIEKLGVDIVAKREIDGSGVTQVASTCLESLQADLHDSVSVAFEFFGDSNIAEQSVSTAVLGMAVGMELGLDVPNLRTLGTAGCLANVGLSQVPLEIRNARRPLTPGERLEMQKVPGRSLNMLEKVTNTPAVVRIVVHQMQERPDGSGYPRGLTGERIHPFARVLRVADDYQASLIGRHQSSSETPYQAMESLLRQAQKRRVDPAVVRSHLHLLSLFPIGSFVRLSDGSVAKVLRSNGSEYTKPIIVRVCDATGAATNQDSDENLIDLLHSDLTATQAVLDSDAATAIGATMRNRYIKKVRYWGFTLAEWIDEFLDAKQPVAAHRWDVIDALGRIVSTFDDQRHAESYIDHLTRARGRHE